ncbi:MAG: HAMP domain-containing protein [Spirochaetia bacterium]|nr:HAMP domain-containing protein [Spirochaetia bacterium]
MRLPKNILSLRSRLGLRLRLRLLSKFILAFTAVIILFGGIVIGTSRLVTESQFEQFTKESDIQLSNNIAYSLTQELESMRSFGADAEAEDDTGPPSQEELTAIYQVIQQQQDVLDYYEYYETGNGKAESNAGVVSRGGPRMGTMGSMGNMGMNMMRSPELREGSEGVPADQNSFILPMRNFMHSSDTSQLLITDDEGEVLLLSKNTPGYRDILDSSPFDTDKGAPIFYGEYPVGYVFAGSMIDQDLNTMAQTFLKSINRTVLIGALVAFLLAMGVSIALFSHIIAPVSSLKRASEKISRGKYGVEVSVSRQDELGELSSSFNDMSRSLQASEQWKRQIISDLAHELRTPVSLLLGELEMMKEGIYPLNTEQIVHMQDEVGMLSQLIQEMQELSSAEAGTVIINRSREDMHELVEETIHEFAGEAQRLGIQLQRNQAVPKGCRSVDKADTLWAEVDRKKMRQVLNNILVNAFRYVPAKGFIDISLMVCSGESQISGKSQYFMISIEDSGSGIPTEERKKIFDRFYRIEKHRGRNDGGGTGLGLAICSGIVNLHGGEIQAEDSLVYGGARFSIRLPLQA